MIRHYPQLFDDFQNRLVGILHIRLLMSQFYIHVRIDIYGTNEKIRFCEMGIPGVGYGIFLNGLVSTDHNEINIWLKR